MSVVDAADRERLRLDVPAIAERVGDVRRALVAFAADAGATEGQQVSIALGVSEAASNVVMHAYREHPSPGRLVVDAWAQDDALHVHVIDEGMGMKRRLDSPGAGFGLRVIAGVTEYFDVESRGAGRGVQLRLIFALS